MKKQIEEQTELLEAAKYRKKEIKINELKTKHSEAMLTLLVTLLVEADSIISLTSRGELTCTEVRFCTKVPSRLSRICSSELLLSTNKSLNSSL